MLLPTTLETRKTIGHASNMPATTTRNQGHVNNTYRTHDGRLPVKEVVTGRAR